MRFFALVNLLLLSALPIAAAPPTDISGQWTAQTLMGPSGSEQAIPTTFTFHVEGGKLSGAVVSPRGKYEIQNGKVDGDTITFSILVTAGNFKLLYDGKITEEGIDFIAKIEGGERSDHFLAKRMPA
ncbi:MAG: hypothetical protein WD733_26340 [Bryobacterales bacterium]